MHFSIVDDKYICVKNNNVEPKSYCLNGNNKNTPKFELLNGEYFEWIIENINNNKINDSTTIIESPSTTSVKYKPTIINNCKISGFPCCLDPFIDIIYTDEVGEWGIENDDWCIIVPKSISATATNNNNNNCYFEKLGFSCCSNRNIKIEYTDDTGNWGIENGNWCGIIETKSTSTTVIKSTTTGSIISTTSSISLPTSVEYQTVYIYNRYSNKCLYEPTKKDNRPILSECDNSNKSKWLIPKSKTGFYKSVNNGWCLQVKDVDAGTIIVGDCSNTHSIMQDIAKSKGKEAIWTTLSDFKCLGSYNNTNKLNLNTCDTNNLDQHWVIIPNGGCGKDNYNFQCPSNKCCSEYGYCGTTDDYCGSGCQSEFGVCN